MSDKTLNNSENLKSLYFAGLGVWSLIEERAKKTFVFLKKEGEEYDRTIASRIEERKKFLTDWQSNLTSRAKEEWKGITTKEGWEARLKQAKDDLTKVTTTFVPWKKDGSETAETNGHHADSEPIAGEVVESSPSLN